MRTIGDDEAEGCSTRALRAGGSGRLRLRAFMPWLCHPGEPGHRL